MYLTVDALDECTQGRPGSSTSFRLLMRPDKPAIAIQTPGVATCQRHLSHIGAVTFASNNRVVLAVAGPPVTHKIAVAL